MKSGNTAEQPPADVAAQARRLEKLGIWLMGAYWLAILAVFIIGGAANGG
jgi:hypothetical protein